MPASSPKYFDVNDAAARQNWEKDLYYNAIRQLGFMNPELGLVGPEKDKLCQTKATPFERGGTRATITAAIQSYPTLVRGNQKLKGRESGFESPTFSYDINIVRFAKKIDGEITGARVEWDVMATAKDLIADEAVQVLEAGAMMQLTGFSINADRDKEPFLQGADLAATINNAPTTADSDHFVRMGGVATDALVGANAALTMDVDDIMRLEVRARILPNPIRPVYIPALKRKAYVLFVHPNVRQEWLTQGAQWYSIALAALQGGDIDRNMLVTGASGFIHNTLIVESAFMPPGIDSTSPVDNTRRFAFCGAQALTLGLPRENEGSKTLNMFKLTDIKQVDDYGDKVGIGVKMFAGLAKPRFSITEGTTATTRDWGVIAGTSYAADLTGWS